MRHLALPAHRDERPVRGTSGRLRLDQRRPRIQALLIAFCFGGLLEALAGFGAPVAITATMIIALGVAPPDRRNRPPRQHRPVAAPSPSRSRRPVPSPAYRRRDRAGRRPPGADPRALRPLLLLIVDGRRGLRRCGRSPWSPVSAFALAQFVTSNHSRSSSPISSPRSSRLPRPSSSSVLAAVRLGRGSPTGSPPNVMPSSARAPSPPRLATAHPSPGLDGALPLPARHRGLLGLGSSRRSRCSSSATRRSRTPPGRRSTSAPT